MSKLFWPLARHSNVISNTIDIFWFIEITRTPHSSNQSKNWMQSENYEYTILTVIPQHKRDL